MHILDEYSKLAGSIKAAQDRMKEIEAELKAEVTETGSKVSSHGYTARMKPGRKSTDHEAAAQAAGVDEEIVVKFTTTPKPRIAWAKVTKAAGVDLSEFTKQADPSFVVEKDK